MIKNMKKALLSLLAIAMIAGLLTIPAQAAQAAPPPVQTLSGPATGMLYATPTASTVLVNGRSVSFDAYNIGGNNYFKLRDIAYTLSDTVKRFNVGWDAANNAISLTSGRRYAEVGGEMSRGSSGIKTPTPTRSTIYLNGRETQFTAYNIDGSNYFKLRDIGQAFNFSVDWDGSRNTIVIDTSRRYTEDDGTFAYSNSYFGAAQGSAKSPEGRCLLVSIFISRSGSSWSSSDVETTSQSLSVATSWIEAEGRRYGKDIEFIFDVSANPDPRYNMTYDGEFYEYPNVIQTSYEDEDGLIKTTNIAIDSFIESEVPYLWLADKYGTDNIAYMVFVEYGRDSRSYAYWYTVGGLENRYHEKTYIMSVQNPPSVIAHEMLHLFGAMDFYVEGRRMGVSKELTEYAKNNYPDDIMITAWIYDSSGNRVNDRITKVISPLTAYRIGWLDDIPELRQFPEFKLDVPAAVVNILLEMNGLGTWTYDTGAVYTGNFDYGVRSGYGVMTWPEGHRFEGNWVEGDYTGYGIMYYGTGEVYEGNWENNVRSGHGVITLLNGEVYDGNWVEGVRSGQGVATYATGEVYTGGWADGVRSGFGVMTWPAGHRYEGNWLNGLYSGYGVLTRADGTVQDGSWSEGRFLG